MPLSSVSDREAFSPPWCINKEVSQGFKSVYPNCASYMLMSSRLGDSQQSPYTWHQLVRSINLCTKGSTEVCSPDQRVCQIYVDRVSCTCPEGRPKCESCSCTHTFSSGYAQTSPEDLKLLLTYKEAQTTIAFAHHRHTRSEPLKNGESWF